LERYTNAGAALAYASGSNDTIDASNNAYWTPASNANGTLNAFTVVAEDNDGGESTPAVQATVLVTDVNDVPTLTSFSGTIDTTNEDTEIELTLAEFKAKGNEADSDGTVDGFVVKAVSTGSLKIGANAGAALAYASGSNDTIDASNNAYWTPASNANGTLNAFTVVAEDNDGDESSSAVQATVLVNDVNDVPTLTTFTTVIDHTTPNTEVELTMTELEEQGDEADADGTVDSFMIKAVSTGTLKIGASADTALAFDAATNNTVNATNNAYWTPDGGNNETLNAFTVVAVDNNSAESATPIQAQVFVTINDTVTPQAGAVELTVTTTATDPVGNPVVYGLTIIPTDDNPPTAPVSSTNGIVDIDSTSGSNGYSIVVEFNLPVGSTSIFTGYWKYGPETGGADHWYDYGTLASHAGGAYDGTGYEITNAGKTLKVYITDGIRGDDDLVADGDITDPGLPVILGADGNPIPTTSFWGLMIMSILMSIIGINYQKKKNL